MALEATVTSPFNVLVKMDGAIGDTYTVVHECIDGASIQITGGNPQTFTPANWNTNQSLPVLGNFIGEYKMRATSTAPYYIDGNGGLKKKYSYYTLKIKPYIGWEVSGNVIGPNFFPLLVAKLVIGGTAAEGLGQSFKVKSSIGGNQVTFTIVKPDASAFAADTDLYGEKTFIANQAGTWYAYAFTRPGGIAGADFSESMLFTNFNASTLNIPGIPVLATSYTQPAQHMGTGTTPQLFTRPLWGTRRGIQVRGNTTPGFSPSGASGNPFPFNFLDNGYVDNEIEASMPTPAVSSPGFTMAGYYQFRVDANPADTYLYYGPNSTSGLVVLVIPFNIP